MSKAAIYALLVLVAIAAIAFMPLTARRSVTKRKQRTDGAGGDAGGASNGRADDCGSVEDGGGDGGGGD